MSNAGPLQIPTEELIFIFSIIILFIVLLVGFFLFVLTNYYKANAKKQEEILKSIVETQESERERIAMDIHDDLGQMLSAVKLQLSSVRRTNNLSLPLFDDSMQLLNQSIVHIRRIVRDLTPSEIEMRGISGALNDLKTQLENSKEIQFELSCPENLSRFSHASEVNIYRIIREIVNNAVKHSGANLIRVFISDEKESLKVEVSDNGKGFNPDEVKKGSGLKNIESRIRFIHGEYELEIEAGKGTCYRIYFPRKYLK